MQPRPIAADPEENPDPKGPTQRSKSGNPLPADIEFAFKDGKLALLQIRPFVESKSAQRNLYLSKLDAGLSKRLTKRVNLSGIPRADGL